MFFVAGFFFGAVAGFGACFHAFLHGCGIFDLAFMLKDGVDLGVPGVGDVDGGVGFARQADPEFAGLMGLMSFSEQFREEEGAACGWEGGVKDDLPGCTVIGVVDGVGLAGVEIGRVASDENVGSELTDGACHRAPRVHIGNQITVRAIKKVDFFCADDFGCVPLLFMAALTEVIPGEFRVAVAFVAAGQQTIGDLMSCFCPAGEGGTAKEFGIVRVGENDKYFLRGGPVFRVEVCHSWLKMGFILAIGLR